MKPNSPEMLRYLTHKLRTQSLNESEEIQTKANDDHDSGTESDDESANIEELQKYMENSILLGSNRRSHYPRRVTSTAGGEVIDDGDGDDESEDSTNHGSEGHAHMKAFQPNGGTSRRRHTSNHTHSNHRSPVKGDSPFPEVALDSALPSDSDHNFDQHSSEEELEVINSCVLGGRGDHRGSDSRGVKGEEVYNQTEVTDTNQSLPRVGGGVTTGSTNRLPSCRLSNHAQSNGIGRPPSTSLVQPNYYPMTASLSSNSLTSGGGAQYPEKRKWSQANRLSLGEERSVSQGRSTGGSGGVDNSSEDDDEEVKDLVCFSTPVEFRTSPPANVHKPSRSLISPPPKVFHSASGDLPPVELCSVSPRKRHRRTPVSNGGHHHHHGAIQRPCLDFEKMQQIRVRLV